MNPCSRQCALEVLDVYNECAAEMAFMAEALKLVNSELEQGDIITARAGVNRTVNALNHLATVLFEAADQRHKEIGVM